MGVDVHGEVGFVDLSSPEAERLLNALRRWRDTHDGDEAWATTLFDRQGGTVMFTIAPRSTLSSTEAHAESDTGNADASPASTLAGEAARALSPR